MGFPCASGAPITKRSADVIIIYQESIESICRTDEDVRNEVRETVLHEVGHYFGLDERTLRDIESAAGFPARKETNMSKRFEASSQL